MDSPKTNFLVDEKTGITQPISDAKPSLNEISQSTHFRSFLLEISPPETAEERSKQKAVLGEINEIYTNWMKSLDTENETPSFKHTSSLIYTFGSFRLGVHERGADIDTLLIGPNSVSHEIFFTDFCDGVLSKHEKVAKYSTVRNAFVPITKFEFDGIAIDLIYAQVASDVLDERFDIHDDEIMRAVTPHTIRSLNGVRVTDMLLDLVPDEEVFRNVVRFIKIWAKRRGIYGNATGYLGGVSYSILVARICQLYPNANEAVVVRQFFSIYDLWHWPTPVCLKHIRTNGPGDHVVWTRDANLYDRMPVVTPAYPSQNSTFNVTFSNFTFLKEEIERGREIVENEALAPEAMYSKLIEGNAFFSRHKHFFQITGECPESDDWSAWFGWINSRVRKFVALMEEMLCFQLVPYPDAFHSLKEDGLKSVHFFVGSKIIANKNEITQLKRKKKRIDITPAVLTFVSHIKKFAGRSEGMKIKVNYVSRSKLPEFVFESESTQVVGAKRTRTGEK